MKLSFAAGMEFLKSFKPDIDSRAANRMIGAALGIRIPSRRTGLGSGNDKSSKKSADKAEIPTKWNNRAADSKSLPAGDAWDY